MKTRLMFHAALVALAFSCGFTGTLSARAAGPVRMADVIIEYTADSSNAERFYDLRWSAVRLERLDRLSTDWLAKLAALDFDGWIRRAKSITCCSATDWNSRERASFATAGDWLKSTR